MPDKRNISRVISAIIGGYLLGRPFFWPGVGVYPALSLMRDVVRVDSESFLAVSLGVISVLAHLSVGSLIISLGFDSLRKLRKPFAYVAAVSAAIIGVFVVYIFIVSR